MAKVITLWVATDNAEKVRITEEAARERIRRAVTVNEFIESPAKVQPNT